LAPQFLWFLDSHMHMSLHYTYERMKADSRRLYTAHIGRLNVVYHLNTRTFFRSLLQYVSYNYNTDNYSYEIDPEYKHLFVQLLFSYKLNPQTVVFLGYTDNYLGNQDYGITRNERTLFLKIGYVWQF
jgi:hypothetical protein